MADRCKKSVSADTSPRLLLGGRTLDDLDQVRDFGNHPADREGVFPLDNLIKASKAQALHNYLMLFRSADRGPDILQVEAGAGGRLLLRSLIADARHGL